VTLGIGDIPSQLCPGRKTARLMAERGVGADAIHKVVYANALSNGRFDGRDKFIKAGPNVFPTFASMDSIRHAA
jgi:hypothetical protein